MTAIVTPGQYLKARRLAAGLTLAAVAARLATEPRLAEHVRAVWIELIEDDSHPATFNTVVALRSAFPFDMQVLVQLVSIGMGGKLPLPRLCRTCACSDGCGCPGGCSWVAFDLCSRCVDARAAPTGIDA